MPKEYYVGRSHRTNKLSQIPKTMSNWHELRIFYISKNEVKRYDNIYSVKAYVDAIDDISDIGFIEYRKQIPGSTFIKYKLQ